MESVRPALHALLADRRSGEARALFELLARYITRRVSRVGGQVLSEVQAEEVVADVLTKLISSALASFRGDTEGELIAFVRTATDRTVWRALQRVRRERTWLLEQGDETALDWAARLASPDALVECVPEDLLDPADAEYLRSLLQAGSKVELARLHGVSRAAVTQRLHRIQARVASRGESSKDEFNAWLRREATSVLAG